MVGAIWIVTLVAVIFTIFYAPDKPEAPPPSSLSYEDKPDSSARAAAYSTGDSSTQKQTGPKVVPAVDKESDQFAYLVQGIVTDKRTGKPIHEAHISYKRLGSKEEASLSQEQLTGHEFRGFYTITDQKGRYALRVPMAGEFRLSVHRRNYITFSYVGTMEEGDRVLTKDVALVTGAQVSGRVIEAGTSRGAPEVGIHIDGTQHSYSGAQTDENGNYMLGGLVPGSYDIYLDVSEAPYLPVGKEAVRTVTITRPDEELRGVDFTVEAAGEVWGYVVTQKKEPVPGVGLILCDSTSPFSQLMKHGIKMTPPAHGSSKTDGYYEIMGVPLDKEWRLYAAAEKTAPQLTSPFLLTRSQRSARIDIFLAPGTTVYGRVVDTEGKPIERAEIVCMPGYSKLFSPLDTAHAFRPEKSDENGQFEIPSLPAGEYQILAQKDGYKFAAQGEPIYPNGHTDIRNVEIVLEPVGEGDSSVYGTVTDSSGRPIENVRLSLATMASEDLSGESFKTETDAKGYYSFTGIKPGLLLLTAEKDGYQGKNVSNVRLDEPTDIVMDSTSTVRGMVLVRETNEPPQYFTIHARQDAGETESLESSLDRMFGDHSGRWFSGGDDGSFEISLAPGEYTLEARSPGLTPGRTQVSVRAGQDVDGVRIELRQAGGRIRGRVVTADGAPAAGALTWLSTGGTFNYFGGMDGDRPSRNVQVGADGSFEFERLAAGTYTVMASLEGYAQSKSAPIELGDGKTVSDVRIVLSGGGSLQGTVEFDGQLAAGALVTVAGDGFAEVATSDANGRYRIDGIPPGDYMASAVSLDGNPIMGLVAPLHGRVTIAEGQVTTYNFGEPTHTALEGLCTPVPQMGTYGFAILLVPGAPIDLRTLNFMNPTSLFQDSSSLMQYIVGMSPVGADGYFRMDNLIQGEYTLIVIYASMGEIMSGGIQPGYVGSVRIPSGETTQVDITIVH